MCRLPTQVQTRIVKDDGSRQLTDRQFTFAHNSRLAHLQERRQIKIDCLDRFTHNLPFTFESWQGSYGSPAPAIRLPDGRIRL